MDDGAGRARNSAAGVFGLARYDFRDVCPGQLYPGFLARATSVGTLQHLLEMYSGPPVQKPATLTALMKDVRRVAGVSPAQTPGFYQYWKPNALMDHCEQGSQGQKDSYCQPRKVSSTYSWRGLAPLMTQMVKSIRPVARRILPSASQTGSRG